MPANYYSEHIAYRLAEILDRIGITDYQLAQMMGKSRSQISAWLKGDANLTLSTIQAIEEVLGEPLILITSDANLSSAQSSTEAGHAPSVPSSGAACPSVSSSPANRLVSATPEAEHAPASNASRRYRRQLPSKPNKSVECQAPTLTAEQRQSKRELPQVLALSAASQQAAAELANPVLKELWKLAWKKALRNVGKHGSDTEFGGRYKVPHILLHFVRKSLLRGKPLSVYYPDLLTTSPEDVLASLSSPS